MMRKLPATIATGIALAALWSCASNGCLDNQNSLPKAGFYSFATGQQVSVVNLSVGGVGAPGDSMLLKNGSASEIYLPFRSTANEASFLFSTGDSSAIVTDQLTFAYENIPYFVDSECGAMYRYRITDVYYEGVIFDSVGITDSLITNVDVERIKIYFHDSTGY